MPDSIYDLQQTLFTSNPPAPTQRGRAQDQSSSFDRALDTAQRNNRDDRRTQESQQPKAADNHKANESESEDDTADVTQDDVIISTEATSELVTEPQVANELPLIDEAELSESKPELTAEEIAGAAALAPVIEQTQPLLKQEFELHSIAVEKPEGIQLNDAVEVDSKKDIAKKVGTLPAVSSELPQQTLETPASTTDQEKVVLDADVEVSDLHSTKTHFTKNQQSTGNNNHLKTENAKITKQQPNKETSDKTGEYSDGAFEVKIESGTEGDSGTPKRRLETTRQVMPEVHETDLNSMLEKAITPVTAVVTGSIAAPELPPETTAKTSETSSVAATARAPTETSAPVNHLRGPQIPHSFTNHLEASGADRKSSDPQDTVDRTRFVQRVARAFQRASETEGEIRLRLSPPELGAVKLEVSLRDGAMVARMETETSTARNLLMDNLPQLKERLAEQNVRIETFEVEVRDQSNQGAADDAREQLREQTELQRNRLRGERASTPVVAQPIVRTLPTVRHSSQLNVVI
jgi:flagellar hook-length control protein FliK